MKIVIHKNLMVLMLLIFVGQVVSAPLFANSECEMEMSSQSMPNHDMAMMDMDCCNDECDCPMDMCLSVIYYSNQVNAIQKVPNSTYLIPSLSFIFEQHLSSIYRPPILS